MRWHDCEARLTWEDDAVQMTLTHTPSQRGLTRRFVPDLEAIAWSRMFEELEEVVEDYLKKHDLLRRTIKSTIPRNFLGGEE